MSTLDALAWEDPPRRGNIDEHPWVEIERLLEERPGAWLRIAAFPTSSGASSLVQSVKKGKTPVDPKLVEVRSARMTSGDQGVESHGVWMRLTSVPAGDPDGEED